MDKIIISRRNITPVALGRVLDRTHLGSKVNPLPDLPDLPTSPTDSQILDYSGLGLTSAQVDDIINELYEDGFVTNCIIDLTGNSMPTSASSFALAGLRAEDGLNNSVATDYELTVSVPTEATTNQVLNYSGLSLNYEQIDKLIDKLYGDGFVTNCIIDLSNNSAPSSDSSVALAALRDTEGMNNTVATD